PGPGRAPVLGRGGDLAGTGVAACSATFVRDPSARARRRPQEPAADAGACGHLHHADLHACAAGAAAAGRGREPSAGRPVERIGRLTLTLEPKRGKQPWLLLPAVEASYRKSEC